MNRHKVKLFKSRRESLCEGITGSFSIVGDIVVDFGIQRWNEGRKVEGNVAFPKERITAKSNCDF